jgi:integrase
MRHYQGYVYRERVGGNWYWMARVCVTDTEGRERNLKTSRKTKTEARLALDGLRKRAKEIAGGRSVNSERMTFADLAKRYAAARLLEPEYRGDQKVRGLKSLSTYALFLEILVEHFGKKRVKTITHADIEAYKNHRLDKKTRYGRPRAIASVNRELQLLRTVLIWAERQRWLDFNPFHTGDPIIHRAQETKRHRLITFEEEDRLLAECIGPRAHLRALVIAAIDTGMRRGELLKLIWEDIRIPTLTISIRALNTKTGKEREAVITDRLAQELHRLWEQSDKNLQSRVFGILNNVKHGFTSACKAASIANLHFHDLRHAFITRASLAGILPSVAMKIAGHQTLEMHSRYLNPDQEAAAHAREALNELYRNRRPAG